MNSQLLVITSFPPKGIVHDKSVVGVASYAKNTLLALKKYNQELKITVLAEKLDGKKENYEDESLSIKRIWKRNSLLTFYTLLKHVYFSKTKTILIEFEVLMFGNLIFLIPFPFFILLLRLMNKKVIVVSHQIITDINDFNGHINLKGPLLPVFLNLTINIFYRLLILFSSKIIVFDEILKNSLSKFGNGAKIVVIPHGVEQFNTNLDKNEAREKLNLAKDSFIVMEFGFLAWYKGTDWLVESVNKIENIGNLKLIIAGGPNPNHMDKKYYLNYLKNIEEKSKINNILMTGFIKQDDIPLYFLASDIVIFPYRTMMSASGPLSIALSFKKAFLVSSNLSGIFETGDIKNLLKSENIDKNRFIFELNSSFFEKIMSLNENIAFQKELENFSAKLAKLRQWDTIGESYCNEIISK